MSKSFSFSFFLLLFMAAVVVVVVMGEWRWPSLLVCSIFRNKFRGKNGEFAYISTDGERN